MICNISNKLVQYRAVDKILSLGGATFSAMAAAGSVARGGLGACPLENLDLGCLTRSEVILTIKKEQFLQQKFLQMFQVKVLVVKI